MQVLRLLFIFTVTSFFPPKIALQNTHGNARRVLASIVTLTLTCTATSCTLTFDKIITFHHYLHNGRQKTGLRSYMST